MLLPVPICFYPRIRCYLFLTALNGCLLVCLPVCLPAATCCYCAADACCCCLLLPAAAACCLLLMLLLPVPICSYPLSACLPVCCCLLLPVCLPAAAYCCCILLLVHTAAAGCCCQSLSSLNFLASAWPPKTPPECMILRGFLRFYLILKRIADSHTFPGFRHFRPALLQIHDFT